jgi:hypothetical protein
MAFTATKSVQLNRCVDLSVAATRMIIQSEVATHDWRYLQCLNVKCSRVLARCAKKNPYFPSNIVFHGSGTVLTFVYKAIAQSRSRDFASAYNIEEVGVAWGRGYHACVCRD